MEMFVICKDEDDFVLIIVVFVQWYDFEILVVNLFDFFKFVDIISDLLILIVIGLKVWEFFEIVGIMVDLDLLWLSIQVVEVVGIVCEFYWVSFVGEFGWEIYVLLVNILVFYVVIVKVGVIFFGMYVFNSLWIEKGYCVWKGDFSMDYMLLEFGLDWFVKFDKVEDFFGKIVFLNEKQ